MNKVILVDGNNLLFRSYYATAYSGNFMKNSKGFPTNALYGFVNMINKIINDENPEYMLVAFDKGKTFRHDKYSDYKAGRIQMPDELKMQFPIAKEILTNLGIKWFEIENYEADDIIGTLAKMIDETDEYKGLIVSSDKDLLQLISDKVTMKMLKSKDYVMMTEETFFDIYGLTPDKMIDIKALQGDSSDNIPGVKGIGEKTALKLLQDYGSLEGVYDNISYIKGATATKLINGREKAFESKDLATIYKEVPLGFGLEEVKIQKGNIEELKKEYEKLEFYSFLKNMKIQKPKEKIDVKTLEDINQIDELKEPISFYIETDKTNYHLANLIAMGVYDGQNAFYVKKEQIKDVIEKINSKQKYTYDLKKHYVVLKKLGITLNDVSFDSSIAAYLLNYNVKDDIAYLANQFGFDIPFFEIITKSKSIDEETIKKLVVEKAKFIYETKQELEDEMTKEDCMYLFNEIEMPLSIVLGDMEYQGIRLDKQVLDNMNVELDERIKEISEKIYELAGEKFNISSPKQLGEILFVKLQIGKGKKTKSGYSTDKTILEKYSDRHPIVPLVLEHRMLTKLQSTYIVGLASSVLDDGKIHTIYTQTLTRTGRLSSIEPNLQNIPIRTTYGKLIRKAFVPEDDCILLSSDYSQIELRVFAHFSKVPNLIDAFKNDMDIHTRTAMDIFGVSENEVTPLMRRQAKAVNFGILYGISSFGLSEDLKIPVKEAKSFIDKYFETYSGTKVYMDSVVKDAYEKGYVTTIMNRKRRIDELHNTNYMIRQQGERMALNTPIQGSSADILKKAMIDIYNEFQSKNIKSKMLLQVHDELIFNVLKEEESVVKEIVDRCMDNAYKLDVPLKVDIETGVNWYDAK
ncbi:MAG: DNA polymerase I [Candidatus Aphodocola sp.]